MVVESLDNTLLDLIKIIVSMKLFYLIYYCINIQNETAQENYF